MTFENGLTEKEALSRFNQEGPNEISVTHRASFFHLILHVLLEPMFVLLLIGAFLYFLLGRPSESFLLLGFVLFIIGITVRQEYKSERALQALKALSSPRALVIRDGIAKRIAGREVVREDIVIVSEGDRVPADAKLLPNQTILVDESLLTGESLPVQKTDEAEIYAGTYILQGKATAIVEKIGLQTVLGKMGVQVSAIKTERTPLQKETDRLVRIVAFFGLAISLLVSIIYGVTQQNWLHGLLAGIALAMAILPEEIPVILTIFLSLGAYRISRENVLTRRVPAVEALGAATVLCVDKTGTLTENRMSVQSLYAASENAHWSSQTSEATFPEDFHALVEFAILASQKDPFDPTEIAIKNLGQHYLNHTEHLHENWKLVQQYPLSKALLAISLVWQSAKGEDYVIAAKGAPEAIFDLCHLSAVEIEKKSIEVQKMAKAGLRVLGVAKACFKPRALPDEQHDFDFEFLGLIGLADPLRSGVKEAVRICQHAKIRVLMMTGDYPVTAMRIADEIGLSNGSEVMTGGQLALMSDAELQKKIAHIQVFARILPEQKLRIVNALKANGEVVAMTGDGINDAPALQAAHIGIAMGARGTDVARESASLVLLDDNFSSIVSAIRSGRRIFDNIRKAITYVFAVHIPIIGMSLLPVLLQWPLMLLPAHIVFLELIIDPACSIVFEAESAEPDIMRRSPRPMRMHLFSRMTLWRSFLQGFVLLGILATSMIVLHRQGTPTGNLRATLFTMMVIGNVLLILVNRSWTFSLRALFNFRNRALWWVIGIASVSLIAVLYVPYLRALFDFV